MPNAHDVAAYIIANRPPGLTTMKLQKLLYYSQAWSMAWDGAPLFLEPIRAWDRGPVVPSVFKAYEGCKRVLGVPASGDASALNVAQRATVDAVLGFYGTIDGGRLSDLTHLERPWRDAYAPTRPSPPIPVEALASFYRRDLAPEKHFSDAFRRGVDLVLSLSPEDLDELSGDGTPVRVDAADEIAFLEGRGPDPWRT